MKILLPVFMLLSNISFAQVMEVKGGLDGKSISTRTHNGVSSSRVIIQSNLSLGYTTNMGDIPNENMGSGIVNGLNVDTLYFFLNDLDNHRRLSVTCFGYATEKIDLKLNPKSTYSYVVFDPYAKVDAGIQANNSSTKSDYTNQDISEEKLPGWVFEKQGNGRYVGVSDPNLNTEEAFKQALLRAWMLSQIDNKMEVQSHSILEENVNGTDFESNSMATSTLLHTTTLYVGREYRSKYGECFVEFFTKSTSSQNGKMYRFSTDADRCEFRFTQYIQSNNSKSSMSINGTIGYSLYGYDLFTKTIVYSKDKTEHDIWQNKGVSVPLRYKGTSIKKMKSNQGDKTSLGSVISTTGTMLTPESLDEGYWCAFISSLFYEAARYSESYDAQMSMISDKNNSIFKTTAKNTIRISMYEIQINENKLYGEWRTESIEIQNK